MSISRRVCNLSKWLWLAYDLFVLSIKITIAMMIAGYRLILPCPVKNLLGETVLVTGAGHGLGRELAIQLVFLGCTVVCWDINSEELQSTLNLIAENGGKAYGYLVDVANHVRVREIVQKMRKRGIPEVTILIHNAAVLYHEPLLNHTSGDVEKTFRVNVLSYFWTIHEILPSMLRKNKGHIVSVSSMCGIYGTSHKIPYCSSKFAVRGLMEGLQEEVRLHYRKPEIHFTTVYPFYIDTGLAKDPKYRFPYIFGAVSAEYAAKEVIKAMRRNYTEYSIPRCLLTLNAINRMIPGSAMCLILDFLADVERKWRETFDGKTDARSENK